MGVFEVKRQFWLERILDQKQSGVTVREYCEQNNLSEKSYWYFHKKLGNYLIEAAKNMTDVSVEPVFMELPSVTAQPVSGSHSSTAVIRSGTIEVEINDNTSEQLLLKILKAVSNV